VAGKQKSAQRFGWTQGKGSECRLPPKILAANGSGGHSVKFPPFGMAIFEADIATGG
jgi:hypothetical protein